GAGDMCLEELEIRDRPYNGGRLGHVGELRRPVAPMAGPDFEAAAVRPDEQGRDDTLGPDRGRQLLERALSERLARIERGLVELGERDHLKRGVAHRGCSFFRCAWRSP